MGIKDHYSQLTILAACMCAASCSGGAINRAQIGARQAAPGSQLIGDRVEPAVLPATSVPPGSAPGDGRTRLGVSFTSFASAEVRSAALQFTHGNGASFRPAPLSLTASDGTGLRLVSLRARAVIQDPLAFTELHLSFHNPEPRVREGRFTITLPPGAAISRFAMKLDHGWQEAEVVDLQAARHAYEDFLHRGQDPALLEHRAGNSFRARVFPIPAQGVKQIKIAYSQTLEGLNRPYRLQLLGLPHVEELEVSAHVRVPWTERPDVSAPAGLARGQKVVRLNRSNWTPDRDFMVETPSADLGLFSGKLALGRISPRVSTARAPMPSLLVMVDTSASRAAGFRRQVELVGSLLARLRESHGDEVSLQVASFDQEVESVFEGPVGQFSRDHLDQILARRPLGASDLHRALSWAAARGGARRLLLVTDGVATSGQTGAAALRAAVRKLGPGVQRLDVLLVGGIRDEGTMQRLVAGTLERDGVVLDSGAPVAELDRRLSSLVASGLRVTVPGARWVWPATLDGVQSGDQRLIFATFRREITARGAEMTVSLTGAAPQQHAVQLVPVEQPLMKRAWAGARISALQGKRAKRHVRSRQAERLRKEIVALSIKHRVLSDHTAMLVLETDEDYAHYKIRRTAPADILEVGPGGVVVTRRKAQPVAQSSRAVAASETMTAPGDRSGLSRAALAPAPPPARSANPPQASSGNGMAAAGGRRVYRIFQSFVIRTEGADDSGEQPLPAKKNGPPALSGELAAVKDLLERGVVDAALVKALRWRTRDPGDVLGLVALGQALQALGNDRLAARAYGSIIDLFPSRADMRRFAGERLEALGSHGMSLARDTFEKAVAQRPDHPSGHRLLAMTLLRDGQPEKALAVLEASLKQRYPVDRPGVKRVLSEDLGLVAAVLAARDPGKRPALTRRLSTLGAKIPEKPGLRFVLTWQTDANDVDLHVHDAVGGHAYFKSSHLPSGGALYADVTNGYGPECFAINGVPFAFPYNLRIHYFAKGPMGYGMGKVQVIHHDGKGGLRFEDRPFVVMNKDAFVDLGMVKE